MTGLAEPWARTSDRRVWAAAADGAALFAWPDRGRWAARVRWPDLRRGSATRYGFSTRASAQQWAERQALSTALCRADRCAECGGCGCPCHTSETTRRAQTWQVMKQTDPAGYATVLLAIEAGTRAAAATIEGGTL